ncbi:MAG: glycosyltransferase family 2 protein [Flavobacteriales bacterium]
MIFTVVIPVYNRPDELRRALKSVLSQTVQDFEVYVVDDCSSVDLKPVVDAFEDKRIHFHRMEQKGNANVSRNYGILNAQGDYIALLDSDDEWLPDHMEKSLTTIQREGADGVYGSALVFDGEKTTLVAARPFSGKNGAANYLLAGGSATTPSMVINAWAAKNILFNEELSRHQDYDFTIRFADKFSWCCKWEATTLVHWKKGEERKRNHESELKFMYRHQERFTKKIWVHYFMDQYAYYKQSGAEEGTLNKYRAELDKHVAFMSFADFATVHNANGGMMAFISNFFNYGLKLIKSRF